MNLKQESRWPLRGRGGGGVSAYRYITSNYRQTCGLNYRISLVVSSIVEMSINKIIL